MIPNAHIHIKLVHGTFYVFKQIINCIHNIENKCFMTFKQCKNVEGYIVILLFPIFFLLKYK